ncbi:MAG: patatin-like phospholipase family protein [Christensenellales bacterium]|jgi:NTE family protein
MRKKVGLALGSGGSRGFAHIGIIKALRENDIPIDCISGSSMGAVVGAVYASGADMDIAAKLAVELNERMYLDVLVPKRGFIKGERIQSLIKTLTKDYDFDQLEIPFCCLACDLENAEAVVLNSGKVHDAVRASISIPGIMVPHKLNGRMLVDGGVIERVPVEAARQLGADIVIASDVAYKGSKHPEAKTLIDIIMQSIDIMQWELAKVKTLGADVLLLPEVSHINSLSNERADECIEIGYECAIEALPIIKEKLES